MSPTEETTTKRNRKKEKPFSPFYGRLSDVITWHIEQKKIKSVDNLFREKRERENIYSFVNKSRDLDEPWYDY